MKKAAIIFILFTLLISSLSAQYFSIGTDPSNVKWETIKTKNYRLIFPKDYRLQAQKIMNKLEYQHKVIGKSIQSTPRKFPMIIHNRTVYSNGYTAYTPRRIELLTYPSWDIYSQPWIDQLLLHEVRHIRQMDKLKNSTLGDLYILFGEQIIGGFMGIYIPSWFFEGDAVLTETLLSESGRGRVPLFDAPLRASLVNKRVYSYNKSLFGSYKNYVADSYQQGYHLVKYARLIYGEDFWANNLNEVSEAPFNPNPFFYQFKEQSGFKISKFYQKTMNELKNSEKKRIDTSVFSNWATALNKISKDYINYSQVSKLNDSTIIAYKKSYSKAPCLVLICNGIETKLINNSMLIDGSLSASNNNAVWTEYNFNPRWEQASTSNLRLYDNNLKTISTVISNTRYQYPELSKLNSNIIAVDYDIQDISTVHVLDKNGIIISKIASPDGSQIIQPRWCEKDTAFVAILLNENGKRLAKYSFLTKSWEDLTQSTYTDFLLWQVVDNKVIITMSYNHNTPACEFSLSDKSLKIIANRPFGIESVSYFNSNQLLVSEITENGNRPIFTDILSKGENININQPYIGNSDLSILGKYDSVVDFSKSNDSIYKVKKYSKLLNLFKIHSWGPIYINNENKTIQPGLSITSHNDLSSSFLSTGFLYNVAEQVIRFNTTYSYQGFYPVVDCSMETGLRAGNYVGIRDTIRYTWKQNDYSLGVTIPLVFQKPAYYMPFSATAKFAMMDIENKSTSNYKYQNGNMSAMLFRLYSGIFKHKATRDLKPKFGISLEANYNISVSGNLNAGNIFALECNTYLPGVFKNHNLQLYFGGQTIIKQQLAFASLINYPRAFYGIFSTDSYTASANYSFPLFYPDWSFGRLLYIKRFYANMFYDYSNWRKNNSNSIYEYQGVGVELISDSHWLRLVAPISIGGRFTYQTATKKVISEFLLGINLNNL